MEIFSEDTKKILAKLAALAVIFVTVSLFLELTPENPIERLRQKNKSAVLERVSDEPFPEISAEAFLVRRLKTSETIVAKNETQVYAIASLVKMMTSLLFVENIPPLWQIVISQDASAHLEPDEKHSKALAGDIFKAEDLLKLVMAESDNDIAYAVTENTIVKIKQELKIASFQERIAEFVFMMNQRGRKLGLRGTNFTNPAGRDNLLNFSTAEDLFTIIREISAKAPEIWTASRIVEGNIRSAAGTIYSIENTNKLLKEFPAIYGSKTGFSDAAGEALVMLYELSPNDPIAVIILKSKDRFNDGRTILKWLDRNYRIIQSD